MKYNSFASRVFLRWRIVALTGLVLTLLASSNARLDSGRSAAQQTERTSTAERLRQAQAARKSKQPAPDASTGSTSLYTLTGSGAPTSNGDYVSASGALNTSYRYFVEVPAGLSRLVIDIFDADIGLGGSGEATAGRDRARSGLNTSANYSLFSPGGQPRNTLFITGDAANPVGSDNTWMSLFDSTGDNVRDNFSAVSYTNNNGTFSWATNWLETNDDGSASSGLIQVTGGRLSITDDGNAAPSTITREANLSANGFSTATFSFDFSTLNTEVGDQMRVEVSGNGGSSWTTLETFTGTFAASSRSYDISSFIATNTRIRFIEVTGYSGTDSFFVDNVQIKENSIQAGHWEVRVNLSSAITAGDDINAIGLRAHDGTAGAGGTELNMYVDSINGMGSNPPGSGTTSRTYTVYPYITSGCTCSENDFDFDSNNGAVGSMNFTSLTGAFTQNIASAALSTDNAWKRNTISGWTSDAVASEYGIWTGSVTINSYLVGGTPNGNYSDIYLANFQAAANPPAANPTANAFRIYLPNDSGSAPVKPFLEQNAVHIAGPNPPVVGQTSTMGLVVTITNPTAKAITFSAANLVTANIPGAGAVYGGSASVSQGSIVSQPSVGGTGNITWNPGTVAAGATAFLAYAVSVTPTSPAQRIPITATPASGNGTRARYVDETGNAVQARATYQFGPLCELAVTAGQPSAAPSSISGRITNESGEPVGGVIVSLAGDKNDRTITNGDGRYRFDNVDINGFYSVTPALANFAFNPASRAFSLLAEKTDAVFTALAVNATENPLDNAGYFVRQQYLDFLGREPDREGWLYWTGDLEGCLADAQCSNARRINVSAAFFVSEEFQQTGDFIYRLYRAGLGRQLSYGEFREDHARLLSGSAQDRASFSADFVQRNEFQTRYSNAGDAQSFVDALLDTIQRTSGVDLSQQRSALMNAYQQGRDQNESRSLALQMAIDSSAFEQTEFNRAFVLMQYFGYLRRDPDAAGFDFWLDVLNNRNHNDYRGMVCSFISSDEYQRRFAIVVTHHDSDCAQ